MGNNRISMKKMADETARHIAAINSMEQDLAGVGEKYRRP
jgi:hypothetical protein